MTDHAGQVELSVKPENNHHVIPYLYGTDEDSTEIEEAEDTVEIKKDASVEFVLDEAPEL